jgi:hypothetical protein
MEVLLITTDNTTAYQTSNSLNHYVEQSYFEKLTVIQLVEKLPTSMEPKYRYCAT